MSHRFYCNNVFIILYLINIIYNRRSSVLEEQITRQLIGLHRAVTHKDKNLLNQLAKQGMDMTLPLRGVTALSLSLYLRHLEMTVELLAALRKTRQIGKGSSINHVVKSLRLLELGYFAIPTQLQVEYL